MLLESSENGLGKDAEVELARGGGRGRGRGVGLTSVLSFCELFVTIEEDDADDNFDDLLTISLDPVNASSGVSG